MKNRTFFDSKRVRATTKRVDVRGEMERREFLRRAVLTGSAAALASLGPWTRTASGVALPIGGVPPLPSNPNDWPVDHIVVLMMENRSFDHYFGWLTFEEDPETGEPKPTNRQVYRNAEGDLVPTHHLGGPATPEYDKPDFRGCGHPDPDHSWDGGREQMEHGFLTGRNDLFAIGYYEPQDVEFYAKLAANFTVCDNYHSSVMAPTFPNRKYMHSAQSGGFKSNVIPLVEDQNFPTGFTWPTIWDLCEEAGVPWGYYFVDLPASALWGPRLAKGTHHIEHFYAAAYAGTLPNVVFVDPGFTTGLRTDEHPYSDIRAGQAYVHNIVKALVESPLWSRTALFINYDEWGGFFDHVQNPPKASDSRADQGFDQLGFRVPCTVISPYAHKGVLASELVPGGVYDHTSILKFIEQRFGLPHLTDRDRDARNIGELLDFESEPNLDGEEVLDLLPKVPVTSLPCRGEELEGTFQPVRGVPEEGWEAVDQVVDARTLPNEILRALNEPFEDDFQAALDSGVFEKFGYRIELKPSRYTFGG